MLLSSAQIEQVFAIFLSLNPHPKTELQYTNCYTLLVAVVLSAQATDKSVNRATESLFSHVQTPQQMCELGEDGLMHYIKSIGLARTKARNIISLSRILLERSQAAKEGVCEDAQENTQESALKGYWVPATREELEALPGVGRKTANVVLNVAFGCDTIPVDTHVMRVANRLGLSSGKTPLAIELDLVAKTPMPYRHFAHHWLILHGRYICKAKKPLCQTCPVNSICPSASNFIQ